MSSTWLVFFVIAVFVLADESCDFSNIDVASRAEVEACFQTIVMDNNLKTELLDNVVKYAEMSAYLDDLRNPPAPYESLRVDLVAEVNALREKDYTYEYELHFDLVSIFKKAKDAHQVYVAPSCFRLFSAIIPYTVGAEVNADGNTEFLFKTYSYTAADLYTNHFGDDYSGYVGWTVDQINHIDTLDFLTTFGDEYQFISKDVGTRLNMALLDDIAYQSLTYGFPYSDSLTFTLTPADGGVSEDITLTFMYIPQVVISSDADFETYCPLDDSVWSRNLESIIMDSEPSGETPAERAVWRMKAHEHLKQHTLDRILEILPTPATSSDEVDDLGASESELVELFRSDYGEMTAAAYVFGFDIVGVIWIGSMAPDFGLYTIPGVIIDLSLLGASKFIIDVRGNGGGYVFLGNQLAWWLNYEIIQPSAGRYRTRLSDTLVTLIENGLSDSDLMEYISHDVLSYQELMENKETLTFQNVDDSEYTQDYMPFYTFEALDYYDANGTLYMTDAYFGTPIMLLQRINVIVVTDGYCGSSCACFAHHLQELGGARFASLGGYWENDEIITQPGIGSFPGGSVIDSEAVGEYMDDLGLSPGDYDLPGQLARGAYLRIPYHKIFSYQNETQCFEFKSTTSELHIPYYTDPAHPSTYSDDHDILIPLVYSNFYIFQDGDAVAAYECVTDISVGGYPYDESMPGFDMDRCEFLYCVSPYYYDYNLGECVQITASNLFTEEKEIDVWMIIAICLIVILVVGVVVFLVLFLKGGLARGGRTLRKPILDADMHV